MLESAALAPPLVSTLVTTQRRSYTQHVHVKRLNSSSLPLKPKYAPQNTGSESEGDSNLFSWDMALAPEDQHHPHIQRQRQPGFTDPSKSRRFSKCGAEEYGTETMAEDASEAHDTVVRFIQTVKNASAAGAWKALQDVAIRHPLGLSAIHSRWLHKFNALLISPNDQSLLPADNNDDLSLTKSRTALPALTVSIQELRRRGPGTVRVWEWNALINLTAAGHRHVSLQDYNAAVDVLDLWQADIQRYREEDIRGGYSITSQKSSSISKDDRPTSSTITLPTIVTFNTLLNIAAHVYSPFAFQDALHRFGAAQRSRASLSELPSLQSLQPDRRSFLAILTYCSRQVNRDSDDPLLATAMNIGTAGRDGIVLPRTNDPLLLANNTISCMLKQGLDVGIDGVNALLWVYAKAGKPEAVYDVYQIMKGYSKPCKSVGRDALPSRAAREKDLPVNTPESVMVGILKESRSSRMSSNSHLAQARGISEEAAPLEEQGGNPLLPQSHRLTGYPAGNGKNSTPNPILELPGMVNVIENLQPDGVTYATTIQSLAYHGYLVPALHVFRDLLMVIREPSSELSKSEAGVGNARLGDYKEGPSISIRKYFSLENQTMVAYRAIFLGFIHHGSGSPSEVDFEGVPTARSGPGSDSESPWTLDSLLSIFHSFVSLPFTNLPSTRFVRTLLIAFQRTMERGQHPPPSSVRPGPNRSAPLHQVPDYQILMEYVYNRLVTDRFEKSKEWADVKDSPEWAQLKEAFLGNSGPTSP